MSGRGGLTDRQRERFDGMVEDVIASLPPALHDLLDEAPVIVEDEPDPRLLELLDIDGADMLCGLHTGTPLTHRSVEGAELPETIHLFRMGIVAQAGGWLESPVPGGPSGGIERVREEIRITLLHELGHHFGLEDDDLECLGYG